MCVYCDYFLCSCLFIFDFPLCQRHNQSYNHSFREVSNVVSLSSSRKSNIHKRIVEARAQL